VWDFLLEPSLAKAGQWKLIQFATEPILVSPIENVQAETSEAKRLDDDYAQRENAGEKWHVEEGYL
jgi:hypothetical protein